MFDFLFINCKILYQFLIMSHTCDYINVVAKDVEITFGDYFDVMPEIGVFDPETMKPIFKTRLNKRGIDAICYYHSIRHDIKIHHISFNIHESSRSYISFYDGKLMFDTISSEIYDLISRIPVGKFEGLVVSVLNGSNKIMHAVTMILGYKRCIFFDQVFKDSTYRNNIGNNSYSTSLYGAKTLKMNYNVNCFFHTQSIQYDMHSCSVLAMEIMVKCLANNAKLMNKILSNKTPHIFVENQKIHCLWQFYLPDELMQMSQNVNDVFRSKSVVYSDIKKRFFSDLKPSLYDKMSSIPYTNVKEVYTNAYLEKCGMQYAELLLRSMHKNVSSN